MDYVVKIVLRLVQANIGQNNCLINPYLNVYICVPLFAPTVMYTVATIALPNSCRRRRSPQHLADDTRSISTTVWWWRRALFGGARDDDIDLGFTKRAAYIHSILRLDDAQREPCNATTRFRESSRRPPFNSV